MTFFAGETLEVLLTNITVSGTPRPALIVSSPTDREKVWQADAGVAALVQTDVSSVQLTVVNALDNTAVVFSDMTYDADKAGWTYLWNVVDAAKYTAWAIVEGDSGVRSWEFGTIRVKTSKLDDSVVDGGGPDDPGEVIDGGSPTSVGSGVLDGGTP